MLASRCPQNPILTPDEKIAWQAEAVFNGCPVKEGNQYHFLFRAIGRKERYYDHDLNLSQIAYTVGQDGLNFEKSRLLITPERDWEQFGCEDPRVTKWGNRHFIFYTALSDYPHTAAGIRIGLAVTRDFKEITKKHLITSFNAKGMGLFPEKVKGKLAVVLTVDSDRPPSKIALFFAKKEAELYSPEAWSAWLENLNKYVLPLSRSPSDHLETGPPPVKTKKGWLMIYSHIQNYGQPGVLFGIEAALLDWKNPRKILGRTRSPLMIPREEYERYGKVPAVVFPSGALLEKDQLRLYYGAADTTCCLARLKMKDLWEEMIPLEKKSFFVKKKKKVILEKFTGNPVIQPLKKHDWESKYTFNPGAVWQQGRVHLLYRAMGETETSVLGYAASEDGFHFRERLPFPVYLPRKKFEKKQKPGFSGCEDPRLTQLGDFYYLCYTAFDGVNPSKVALSTIRTADFLQKKWRWSLPRVVSCPRRNDKNACLLPAKIDGQYVFFHRIGGCIWLDYLKGLTFEDEDWVGGQIILYPRPKSWESQKVGIAAPPLKTELGWLVIYHALSREDDVYRLGAALLDLKKPEIVLARLPYPILSPGEAYELEGQRPKTVFSCGAVVIKEKLLVYYGAADEVIGVAFVKLEELLSALKNYLATEISL